MARKSPESNAEASLPAKKFAPTPAEQAALDRYHDRKKQQPAPDETFKVTHDGENPKIEINHPDPNVGRLLTMDALGTTSHSLFNGLVVQLVGLGMQECELNFAISLVKDIKPRDATEAMLAAQMVAVHLATMRAAHGLANAKYLPQQDSAATVLNKGARTYVAQMEALKRYRSAGEQVVKVQHQHVNVHDGGQAVVAGSMQTGGGRGVNGKNDH
jgi:hypothetical protein